jgi:hypothetical protein
MTATTPFGWRSSRVRVRAGIAPRRRLGRSSFAAGRVGGLDAGGEDDRVHLVELTVGGDKPVRADLGDARGHDVDVRRAERLVVVVGDQDPAAPDRARRHQLLPQRRVRDAAADGAAEPGSMGAISWGNFVKAAARGSSCQ